MTAGEAGDILFDAAIKYCNRAETDWAEVAREIIKATLEDAANLVSVYLADHGIEQAREELPGAIRALAGRDAG